MNEALPQAADSRTNEEEKNREIYTRPGLKKLVTKVTNYSEKQGNDGPMPMS